MELFRSNLRSLKPSYFPHMSNRSTKWKPQMPIHIASRRHRFGIRNNSAHTRRFSWVPQNDNRISGAGVNWWRLSEHNEEEEQSTAAKPITLLRALHRMWNLIETDRWIVFGAFGSLIIAALSEISIPRILAESVFCAQSGDAVVFFRNSKLLALLCITSGICSGLRSGCFGIANIMLVKRLQETLFSVVLVQDISFFDRESVGDLTSRLGADCQRLSLIIANDVNLILRNGLQGTGALINLLILSWPLALSTLVICCVLSVIFLLYGKYQKKAAKLTQDFTAGANEVWKIIDPILKKLQITFGMISFSYSFVGCSRDTFSDENSPGFWNRKKRIWKVQGMARQGSVYKHSREYGLWILEYEFQYSVSLNAGYCSGVRRHFYMSGHVSPEQLTKYVLYCEWLIYATWRVTDNVSSLVQSVGASEKVLQLMDLLPGDQFLSKGVKLQSVMGHIQFINVSFHYPSREKVPILEDINISVQPNEVVAIVGLSGSGKSTLVNLLLRLYEPINGQIYIDGFPLRELDIRWLRGKVGFVAQEPNLFHMNIKSNIKYGCSEDIKEEDIEWAAKQAYAHEFISSLPGGYETLVDDNLLSGGQKQRIAIARAILRDPAILILDEATSALDSETEYHIKGVLHALRNDIKARRTVIVIAHRLSTIEAADRILVMDGGRVVEMGEHAELLEKDGLYRKLVRAQTNALA